MGFQWISWVSPAFNFAVWSIFLKTWVSSLEQSFSTPRRLKTYPANTMKQDQLDSCMLVHWHKTLADTIDPIAIAKTFASANDKGRGILGSPSKRRLVCLKQETRYVGPVGLGHFILFIRTHSPPTPTLLWKAILCSVCCRYNWRLHPGDTSVSSQLTPTRSSKMLN